MKRNQRKRQNRTKRKREGERERGRKITGENHENILQQIKYCCQAVNQVKNYEKQAKRNYNRATTEREREKRGRKQNNRNSREVERE